MKLKLVTLVLLVSSTVHASGMKDFNKVLIQDVQKDIASENDQRLKTRTQMRAPASVPENSKVQKYEIERVEKRDVKQTGMQKW